MYNIIQNLINHSWITNGANEQQYIYYICGAVICLTIVFIYDCFSQLVKSFRKRGD